MARTAKRGLEYLPLDVNIFSDIKIGRLRRKCDADAPLIYIALLCEIYKEGYYIKWNEDFAFVVAEKIHKDEDYVNGVLLACFEVGLLDEDMFTQHRVLTSRGIQAQYNSIAEKSRRKCDIVEYSLLEEEITAQESGIPAQESPISVQESGIPAQESLKMQQECNKEKKSKVKESKEYSSFILPSYEEEINEEEKEEEKIVQYFFFEKNWPAAREEYYKLVAYNNGPQVKKKWDDMTARERMSLAMLWHQEPQQPRRFDDSSLALWRRVYVTLARNAPWAIRMAALDDGVSLVRDRQNFVLAVPSMLREHLEEHLEEYKPIIWPEIQRLGCTRLVYK